MGRPWEICESSASGTGNPSPTFIHETSPIVGGGAPPRTTVPTDANAYEKAAAQNGQRPVLQLNYSRVEKCLMVRTI